MIIAKKLLALLIVTLFFSSCQPSPKGGGKLAKEQILRINLTEDPQTLDPRAVRELNDWALMRMFFEGLTRIDKDEKASLALAKEVEISPDLKTYTFHLRSSRWSNGDPVTAEDFAYSWKKILDPSFPSDYAFQLYVLKNGKAAKQGTVPLDQVGIQVLGPLTLKVELEQPTPYFLQLLASPFFFPVNKKVDLASPAWMQKPTTYVSNGPFLLADMQHRNFIKAQKNPSYWDKDSVRLNEIEVLVLPEETGLRMFEKGQVHWAGSPLSILPVDALKELKTSDLFFTKPILGTHFLRSNVEKTPFNHPWIRWAFALAIDRQAIIDHVLQGNQIPATGIVPTALHLQKEPYFQDGDGKMARALFEASLNRLGLKRENFPEITIIYAHSERNHLITQALQQQWFEAFGIRVKLEALEKKVYFDRISKQGYQLSLGSWIADFNDPVNFLDVFKYKKASTNNTQWENPVFSQLLDNSASLIDPEERKQALSLSEQILMDEMPIIPIYHSTLLYLKEKSLQGVVLTSMGHIDFKWAYFEDQK